MKQSPQKLSEDIGHLFNRTQANKVMHVARSDLLNQVSLADARNKTDFATTL
jgi:hypothetical protein